mgnify:CR=1 FL=1
MVKKLKEKSKDKFSVLIRTKNEENWIGHCIQSILDNLEKPEIIVIDNNSTDSTLDIVRLFVQDPLLNNNKNNLNYTKIKIFKLNSYTPGKALNFGVKKCKYENILILSAHCELKLFNQGSILKNLKKYCCIFGKQEPIFKGKKITKRYIWSHFVNHEVKNMFSKQEKRYFLHNALAFYKKTILKKYPFDENLAGKEDRYWINNMVKRKKNFLYDPSVSAKHHYTLNGNTWKGIG